MQGLSSVCRFTPLENWPAVEGRMTRPVFGRSLMDLRSSSVVVGTTYCRLGVPMRNVSPRKLLGVGRGVIVNQVSLVICWI